MGINSLGREIRLAAQLGEDPLLGAEWHPPLDNSSRYLVRTAASYGRSNLDVFDGRGDRLVEFCVSEFRLDQSMVREFGACGEARLGNSYRTGDVELATGTSDFSDFNYETAQISGCIAVDRLDNCIFPTGG